jgi:hypothetical protein
MAFDRLKKLREMGGYTPGVGQDFVAQQEFGYVPGTGDVASRRRYEAMMGQDKKPKFSGLKPSYPAAHNPFIGFKGIRMGLEPERMNPKAAYAKYFKHYGYT